MYIVIIGAGEIGERVAKKALEDGHDVVVVDERKERCEGVIQKYDLMAIHGDPTNQDVLEDADVGEADALISTLDDPTNLMVDEMVKRMGTDLIISVARKPAARKMLKEKGVTTFGNPNDITADYLYRAIHMPNIEDFLNLSGDTCIIKVSVPKDSGVEGKSSKKINEGEVLPKHTSLIVLERGSEAIIPDEDVELKEGDILTILTRESQIGDVVDTLS